MRAERAVAVRVAACLAAAVFTLAGAAALAEDYPTKSVRMIISFPPGGGSDLIARVVAEKLTTALGQTVVPDNRPGASGNIAAELAAKAPADGYTIFFTNSSLSISPAVYRKLRYNALADLAPITMTSSYPFALAIHPALPVKSVKELVALAKAKPTALAYSSAGAGTMSHFAMELMQMRAGVKLTHLPYKGAGPAAVGVMSGEAQCAFMVMPTAQTHIHAGKLRGLAVAAKERSHVLPDLPTMAEAGVPGNEAVQWNGLFAPARTPRAVLDRLYTETVKALKSPDVKRRFEAEGADPVGNTSAEFTAFFRAEAVKWSEVAKQSGTRLD
jgi:tripartite-type tricarboxylate transporter receptor subunit TctC